MEASQSTHLSAYGDVGVKTAGCFSDGLLTGRGSRKAGRSPSCDRDLVAPSTNRRSVAATAALSRDWTPPAWTAVPRSTAEAARPQLWAAAVRQATSYSSRRRGRSTLTARTKTCKHVVDRVVDLPLSAGHQMGVGAEHEARVGTAARTGDNLTCPPVRAAVPGLSATCAGSIESRSLGRRPRTPSPRRRRGRRRDQRRAYGPAMFATAVFTSKGHRELLGGRGGRAVSLDEPLPVAPSVTPRTGSARDRLANAGRGSAGVVDVRPGVLGPVSARPRPGRWAPEAGWGRPHPSHCQSQLVPTGTTRRDDLRGCGRGTPVASGGGQSSSYRSSPTQRFPAPGWGRTVGAAAPLRRTR